MSVNVGEAKGYLDLDITGFLAGLKTAQSEANTATKSMATTVGTNLTSAGRSITSAGTSLTKNFTVPIVAAGTAIVTISANFEAGMSKVSAISGATGKDLESLKKKAQEMGSKTKFSATEAAKAFEYMAMAGWKTDEMLEGIEPIMNLAAASGEDLALTSDIVTDGLTAFGLSAKDAGHFTDVLAKASSSSNTNVSLLGESFKYVAPVCGALGMSADDVAVALGLMANSGIKGSQAGTALRSALTRLVSPTDDAATVMDQYGISMTNSDGSMKSLSQVMEMLRGKLGHLTEAEQAQVASTLFGKEAMSGMLAIINASEEDYQSLTNSIANCDGAASEMAATMNDNLKGQLTLLKSALEGVALQLGEILLPYVKDFVAKIQKLVQKFSELSPEQQEQIVKFAAIAAAIGPCLVIVGKLITTIGKTISTVRKLKSGLSVLAKAIGGISAPVVAVVAVIAVLVAAFVHLWKTNEEFRNKVIAIWNKVKAAFASFADGIKQRLGALGINFKSITDTIKKVWDGFCQLLAPVFIGAFEIISAALKTVLDVITGILDVFIGIFTGNWNQAWTGVKEIFSGIWEGIKGVLSAVLGTLKGLLDTFLGWLGTNWESVWNSVKSFFSGIWNGIVSFFTGIWTSIKSVVTTAITAVETTITTVLTTISTTFTTIWSAIKTAVSTALTAIKTAITTVWNAVKTFLTTVLAAIKTAVTTAWNTMKTTITTVVNAIKTVVTTVWNAIKTTLTTILTGIKTAITTAWNAIKTTVTTVVNAIKTVITTVWNAIKTAVTTAVNGTKTTVTTVWNAIKTAVTTVVNAIKTVITTVWNAIKTTVTTVVNGIKTTVTTVWNAIKTAVTTTVNGIKTTITTVWNGIKTTITTVMSGIKTGISTAWNNVKTTVSTAVNNIKTTVTNVFNAVKTTVTNVFNSIKSTATSVWNGIKSAIETPINAAKNTISSVVNSIKSTISSGFNAAKGTVKSVFNSIKSSIQSVMDSASNIVSGAINKIKGFFNFSWSLPKLKLPHPSISGSFSLNPPSVPHFSIDWYKKAMDNAMILNGATIFGAKGGNLLGGGEAGSEVVSGADTLMRMIEDAVNNVISGFIEKLESYVQQIMTMFGTSSMNLLNYMAKLVDASHEFVRAVDDIGYIAQSGFTKTKQETRTNDNGSNQKDSGDTFIFNSPKPIDEIEAAKQMKRTKRDMAEGFA